MKLLKRITITLVVVALSLYALAFASQKVMQAVYPQRYQDYVEKYCAEYGVDENLVYAVIKCESGYDNAAVSHANAKGLMQLTEETFEWVQTKTGESLSNEDLFDPETNIKYGTKLLSLNLEEFGDERAAIAAYHAGRSAIMGWLADSRYSSDGVTLQSIPYAETAAYVERVEKIKTIYDKIYRKDD